MDQQRLQFERRIIPADKYQQALSIMDYVADKAMESIPLCTSNQTAFLDIGNAVLLALNQAGPLLSWAITLHKNNRFQICAESGGWILKITFSKFLAQGFSTVEIDGVIRYTGRTVWNEGGDTLFDNRMYLII